MILKVQGLISTENNSFFLSLKYSINIINERIVEILFQNWFSGFVSFFVPFRDLSIKYKRINKRQISSSKFSFHFTHSNGCNFGLKLKWKTFWKFIFWLIYLELNYFPCIERNGLFVINLHCCTCITLKLIYLNYFPKNTLKFCIEQNGLFERKLHCCICITRSKLN